MGLMWCFAREQANQSITMQRTAAPSLPMLINSCPTLDYITAYMIFRFKADKES
jgi:hypothetical protein